MIEDGIVIAVESIFVSPGSIVNCGCADVEEPPHDSSKPMRDTADSPWLVTVSLTSIPVLGFACAKLKSIASRDRSTALSLTPSISSWVASITPDCPIWAFATALATMSAPSSNVASNAFT